MILQHFDKLEFLSFGLNSSDSLRNIFPCSITSLEVVGSRRTVVPGVLAVLADPTQLPRLSSVNLAVDPDPALDPDITRDMADRALAGLAARGTVKHLDGVAEKLSRYIAQSERRYREASD